jgi:hypothetical protein
MEWRMVEYQKKKNSCVQMIQNKRINVYAHFPARSWWRRVYIVISPDNARWMLPRKLTRSACRIVHCLSVQTFR